jgi:phage FluMu gp28-like protein
VGRIGEHTVHPQRRRQPLQRANKRIHAGKYGCSLHHTTFDDALKQGLYKRICLVQKKEWTEEAREAWRKELIGSYGDNAEEELFCVPVRAGTRYFPAVPLEAVSDPEAVVLRKSCEDSFVFERKEKRVKEFEKWLKHEVRGILLSHTSPVYLGEDFARSGDLTCIFLDELLPDGRTRAFLALELRNVPFDQQWQALQYLMNTAPRFGGGAFDARGNGQMIAEYAGQEWPGYVCPVMITTAWYPFPNSKNVWRRDQYSRRPFHTGRFSRWGTQSGRSLRSGKKRRAEGTEARGRRDSEAACAMLEDEEAACQPMTYDAVPTANKYRTRMDA